MQRPKPLMIAVLVAGLAFMATLGGCVLRAAVMPRSFASSARVHITAPINRSDDSSMVPTQIELVRSALVLDDVIQNLKLGQEWGNKYAGGDNLRTSECRDLMVKMLDVRRESQSAVISIRVYSDEPEEAAMIANAIAETFCALPIEKTEGVRGEQIDRAVSNDQAVRPNVPLEMFFGLGIATLLAVVSGAVAGLLVSLSNRARIPVPA